ncbi:MAG: PIN domain-containing protein [Methylobacter sp.]|nr:PIN domain-containing protein [Methylobacter sp.]
MSANVFFDTNVLVYLHSIDEPEKQQAALKQIEANKNRWISTQVLSELSNILRKKFNLEYSNIVTVLTEIQESFQVVTVQPHTIKHALYLAQTYRYSYYDSLILAASLEKTCCFLYSEDMQHQQTIEQQLTIVNPFETIEHQKS